VKTTDYNKILRDYDDYYALYHEKSHDPNVVYVDYNGGYEADEDPADYIRVNIKAVKLA
jgi:hypothetical protein